MAERITHEQAARSADELGALAGTHLPHLQGHRGTLADYIEQCAQVEAERDRLAAEVERHRAGAVRVQDAANWREQRMRDLTNERDRLRNTLAEAEANIPADFKSDDFPRSVELLAEDRDRLAAIVERIADEATIDDSKGYPFAVIYDLEVIEQAATAANAKGVSDG